MFQATDGRLYGSTYWGGTFMAGSVGGTLFSIGIDGSYAFLHSFGGRTSDGANPVAAEVQAADGALYGATSFGGKANAGTVFRYTLP